MNVGMLGLGKLGLPVAAAMASRGLNVYGVDPVVERYPADLTHEDGLSETASAAGSRMHFSTLAEAVGACDVIFCAVATPHEPRFEGIDPLPEDRADFDYSDLRQAVAQVAKEADSQGRQVTLAVISTVLPGTMRREVEPLLGANVSLAYNPSFIAMGTTVSDFLAPEFVLLGGRDKDARDAVAGVYNALGIGSLRPVYSTSIENAELVKVAYNTFIGLKLAFANTLMEICHKTEGTDVDEVTVALALAKRRLISPAYMSGGMGDGGHCHPRDNIALSWLARKLDLSYDLFEATMLQRERQTEWLCELLEAQAKDKRLPIGILGTAYKPGSALDGGSAALLLSRMLVKRGSPVSTFDPYVPGVVRTPTEPHVFLVGCKHPDYPSLELPQGSVVIDPWRYIPDREGVEVIRLGSGE